VPILQIMSKYDQKRSISLHVYNEGIGGVKSYLCCSTLKCLNDGDMLSIAKRCNL